MVVKDADCQFEGFKRYFIRNEVKILFYLLPTFQLTRSKKQKNVLKP